MQRNIDGDGFGALLAPATEFVMELTAIPSISSDELAASEYCYKKFAGLAHVQVERQMLDDTIMDDPGWNCGLYHSKSYEGRFNVIATWKGSGGQEPVYLNAHVDTVAPCAPELMAPYLEGGTVYGLGAHDDKGHVGVIYALFRYMSENHIQLPFDVTAHIVVEEEIGGNGTLFAVRRARRGQAAIILDGCGGVIANACRGAIWPRITCYGNSCHPSDRQSAPVFSAYDFLKKALSIIEGVHVAYCAQVAQNPARYFEGMIPPLNIGMIRAGNWPSTMPTKAVASMVFGVFPEHSNSDMRRRIGEALAADPDLNGHYKLEFIFDVNAGVTPLDDPLITQFKSAMVHAGFPGEVRAFNGACDIGFYTNIMGIPAINVGIGAANAHSRYESIETADIVKLAAALMHWLRLRAAKS